MSDLKNYMRRMFPDFPGDCIDHIIYQTRQECHDEIKSLRIKIRRLEAANRQLSRYIENLLGTDDE